MVVERAIIGVERAIKRDERAITLANGAIIILHQENNFSSWFIRGNSFAI